MKPFEWDFKEELDAAKKELEIWNWEPDENDSPILDILSKIDGTTKVLEQLQEERDRLFTKICIHAGKIVLEQLHKDLEEAHTYFEISKDDDVLLTKLAGEHSMIIMSLRSALDSEISFYDDDERIKVIAKELRAGADKIENHIMARSKTNADKQK